jgi:hypothetical protein
MKTMANITAAIRIKGTLPGCHIRAEAHLY